MSAASQPVYIAPTPFDIRRIGAAAVYCSDGRYGDQMDEFLHHSLGLPRYDRVAVPGGAGCLFHHTHAYAERAALERQLTFLVAAHQLKRVILIAHQDCGFYHNVFLGSQSLMDKQAEDLRWAAERIRQWCPGVAVEHISRGKATAGFVSINGICVDRARRTGIHSPISKWRNGSKQLARFTNWWGEGKIVKSTAWVEERDRGRA